jgi:hypothetical protein
VRDVPDAQLTPAVLVFASLGDPSFASSPDTKGAVFALLGTTLGLVTPIRALGPVS